VFPIGDEPNDPTKKAVVTWVLIVVNVAVFALAKLNGHGDADYQALVTRYGSIPAAPSLSDMFTSMFMHANFMHLGGNMLFLWIYGDNVEARLGHVGFLAAYVATGLAGGLVDALMRPGSAIPGIGASGAISGVLGMYLIGFPKNRVKILMWTYVYAGVMHVPAWLVLAFFFVFQNLFPAIAGAGHLGGGVAYGAHLGGFAAGVVIFLLLLPWHRRATAIERASPW
jgi:membrane associated rhomboid family serine protease